jgi:hypothetical protein
MNTPFLIFFASVIDPSGLLNPLLVFSVSWWVSLASLIARTCLVVLPYLALVER